MSFCSVGHGIDLILKYMSRLIQVHGLQFWTLHENRKQKNIKSAFKINKCPGTYEIILFWLVDCLQSNSRPVLYPLIFMYLFEELK